MKQGVGSKEIVCLVCDTIVPLTRTVNECPTCGKKFLSDGVPYEELCPVENENLAMSGYWDGESFPLFDDSTTTVADVRKREAMTSGDSNVANNNPDN